MSDTSSHARIRIALARFCVAHDIDFEALYAALGIDATQADAEALSHMAGVLDGMSIAARRIAEHGIEDWAKDR
ncbi:hypothetical protein [Parvularcula oceani]|uniref:hypothetical protein n=1 Tax=Parvularcula oceani TaxID=1247963 RepID=UPI00192E6A16|nr:hypothetical protein [Parvularcula oceani]